MEIIIDMLLPTVLYLTRTVYRERDTFNLGLGLLLSSLLIYGCIICIT